MHPSCQLEMEHKAVAGGQCVAKAHFKTAARFQSQTNLNSQSLLATGFSYGREELNRGALDVFREMLLSAREVRRAGSACLDLAHVASGVFAGMWESDLKPHDVAAGALIIEEARGLVTDFAGGGDWLYGRTIIAGNDQIHRQLLDCVQKNFRS